MLEAFALCPGSLPVIGTACTAVSGAVGSAAGAGLSAGVGAVFSEASRWVAGGAVWLIAQVGRAMSATTSIDLDTAWFGAHEAVMATLAAAVVLPMTCCAAIQAVYRQSASMLLRTFFVNLPLSLLFTGVAVTLVRMALAVTDAMSARILSSAGVDTTSLLSGLFTFLVPSAVASAFTIPSFVVFIGGLLVASAALVLWLELVVRAAAVSVAVLFLPLALAALVWPSVAHWCRRLADTLVALVLSKLVIAAVLSLAAGALAGGLGSSGSGSGSGGGGGFAAVVTGIALLVVAILSPFTLLRLVPAVEAGAVGHLESTRQRLKSAAVSPVRNGGNLALEQMRQMKSDGDGADAAVGTVRSEGTGVGAAVGATATAATAGAAAGPSAAAAGAGAGAGAGPGAGASGGSRAAGGVGSSGASAISMVTGVPVAPESGFAGGSGEGAPPVPHAGATPRPAGAASSGDASPAGAAAGPPGTAGGAGGRADAARVVPTGDDADHGDG